MTSNLNIFSIKETNKQQNIKKISPSLKQGKKFKKYQNKIERSLEKSAEILSGKEGFTDMEGKSLTKQTDHVISNNNYSNQQQIIDNLRKEYQNTTKQYEDLVNKISGNLTSYVDRVNPKNQYLNKVVQFTTGDVCYVTSQGIVKYIPSSDVWKSTNISQSIQTKLNIPYLKAYSTPGTQIPTNPPLISGTELQTGQSVGNEGSNVFVNKFLPSDITPKYMGCYAANSSNDNMTFIGGSPPPLTGVTILNGTFSQPVLANNSYKYINSASKVPGWYFGNGVLINNSSAWKYPMPYPGGNQCVSIQNTDYIYTPLTLNTGVNYTITFSGCSRNCCNNPNVGNPINIQLYTNLNAFISTITTITPSVNSWTKYSYTFTVPTTQSYYLYFKGSNTSGDQSTAIANVRLNSSTETGGSYSYNQCKEEAVINGYRYFGLQNVNLSSGLGYCAVSKSEPAVTEYGNSQIPSKLITLWSSNTSGQPGNTATLSNTGSLQVFNSSGQAVYSTPSKKANPSNYLGCYGDNSSSRAMTTEWTDGSQQYDSSQCQTIAQENNYQYYGLQNSTSGTNAQCFLSNDITQTTQYGAASNCTQISDGSWSGGGLSNAVYNATLTQSNYYLIVKDNGNMCVYRGTGPNDKQGKIWASRTRGQQQTENPNMVATKGKYGQNWMPSGSTLSPGDFIGSNDGKLALVMQDDGNLVLYTYEMVTNCQKMSDGNMGGGIGANSAYDIGNTAVTGNIGALGYIDSDSNLYTYPSSNQSYTNDYMTINNMNTPGNDIQGASFSNTTIESCQSACNSNSQCAGFVFSGNTCSPKTNQMFPFSNSVEESSGSQIYVRDKMPSSPPLGVTQNTNTTDTITYQNYINKGQIGSQYGLANANSVQKQELEKLQTKMKLLSNQITDLTIKFQDGALKAENQSQTNSTGIEDYLKDIITTNKKIGLVTGETNGNIHNILTDSDIVVLQKNYDYLFWSILAVGAVLVSMNIVKKQ